MERFVLSGAVAAASLLVFAGTAMAGADPIKGGDTTLNLKVKISKASGGATKTGAKSAELPISGGSLDPVAGTGEVRNGGSLKLKNGKKKVSVSEITTTFGPSGSIRAKVKGKTVTLAKLTGGAAGRAGFGGTVSGASAKLTKAGAKALKKALGGKFKKGKAFGTAGTSTVPSTVEIRTADSVTTEAVALYPNCAIANDCPYAVKTTVGGVNPVTFDGANIDTTNPAAPILTFPTRTKGSMAPDCQTGSFTGSGGIRFEKGADTLTQQNPTNDFSLKTVQFDAFSDTIQYGIASATDLDLSGATCTADPAAKTITLTNVVERVNTPAAQIYNTEFGFTGTTCALGAPPVNCPLVGGDLVGVSNFTITTH
jgi:hypothetical protein